MFSACEEPVKSGLSREADRASRLRNAAMISLLFDSLLRAHELCSLTLADLDLERQRVKVRGKGGKVAWVRFGADTTARLRAWLAVRDAGSPALFVAIGGTAPGEALTVTGLRSILKRIAKRAGVPDLTTHAFRRGGAVAQLEAGAPSRLVQLHGRWDDIRMIEVYTQELDADQLFDRYSPIERLGSNGHAKEHA